jgi:hypothetical protein
MERQKKKKGTLFLFSFPSSLYSLDSNGGNVTPSPSVRTTLRPRPAFSTTPMRLLSKCSSHFPPLLSVRRLPPIIYSQNREERRKGKVEAGEANYVKQDRLDCFVDIHTRRNHKGEIIFLSQCILFRCHIC